MAGWNATAYLQTASVLALVAAMACFGYFKGLYDANLLCWALLACASRMQLSE
ncbi:MAG: hypothetical protein ABSH05_09535 [Bryobacteraceae bacterium]|jgi:hypothetical protein